MEIIENETMDRIFWNILKGIGIVFVVIGHVCPEEMKFVYLFHLPVFFFVSGYLYNEDKYGDNPYKLFAARLKSSWIKYVYACWFIILMHNFFVRNQMVWLRGEEYTLVDVATRMANAMFGDTAEDFANALWYVPVAVIAICLLGIIVYFSRKIYQFTKKTVLKYIFQMMCVLICTLAGYYLEDKQFVLSAHLQVSFVVMPFLWGGYLLRTSKIQFQRYLNPFIAILCSLLLWITNQHYELNLATLQVYPYMHLVAFAGIYVCMYIAKIIRRNIKLCSVFVAFGEASFFIMAIHLPLCRLFDWAYIKLFYTDRFEELYYVISSVVFSEKLWPLYLFVGLGLSLCLAHVIKDLRENISRRIE